MPPSIVQQGRFVFPDDDPMPDRCRYVVTMTNRSRDLDALTRLEPATARSITPYIRLVRLGGRADRVTARRVRDWAAQIRRSVRGPAYYAELTEFDPMQPLAAPAGRRRRNHTGRADGRPLLLALAEELQKEGKRPVPVARLGSMSERQRNLMMAVAHGALGGMAIAVSLSRRWAATPETVNDLLALAYRLRLDPSLTDLLLEAPPDRGERLSPAELAVVISRIAGSAPWRNLVLLSSGIPSIVPAPDDEMLLCVDRPDWPVFCELENLLGEGRPAFGDHGIRHPLRLAWAGTKRANIRYTSGDQTLLAIGEPTRNGVGDPRHYAALCRAIEEHPRFRGGDHCWASRQIAACAAEPGQAMALQSRWDTVGLVHHITELVDQVRAATRSNRMAAPAG